MNSLVCMDQPTAMRTLMLAALPLEFCMWMVTLVAPAITPYARPNEPVGVTKEHAPSEEEPRIPIDRELSCRVRIERRERVGVDLRPHRRQRVQAPPEPSHDTAERTAARETVQASEFLECSLNSPAYGSRPLCGVSPPIPKVRPPPSRVVRTTVCDPRS